MGIPDTVDVALGGERLNTFTQNLGKKTGCLYTVLLFSTTGCSGQHNKAKIESTQAAKEEVILYYSTA